MRGAYRDAAVESDGGLILVLEHDEQFGEIAKRAAMRPEGGYVDLTNLSEARSRRMVSRKDRDETGNCGVYARDSPESHGAPIFRSFEAVLVRATSDGSKTS